MSRVLPMYRRGLLVQLSDRRPARAGSCIFIHVWRSPTTGTAGCVAVPEPRVEALQEFAERWRRARHPAARGARPAAGHAMPKLDAQLRVRFSCALSSENAGICTSKPSPLADTMP